MSNGQFSKRMRKSITILRVALLALSACFSFLINGANENIELLRSRCSKALESRNFKKAKEEARKYYAATEEDTTGKDFGYANFYLGASEIFTGDGNNGGKHLRKALEIGESLGNDSLTGLALNSLGIYEANVNSNYYIGQHYLLRSIDYPGMRATAYRNLAQIARLQRDTAGMQYARSCYEEGVRNKDTFYIYNGLITIAELQIFQGKYNEAMSSLSEAGHVASSGFRGDTIRMPFLRAVVLSHQNHTRASNEILFSLHDSIEKKAPIDLAELELVIGKNYQKEGNYKLSNEWLERAMKSSEKFSSNDYINLIYTLLSDNSRKLGDYEKALNYMTLAWEAESAKAKSELTRMAKERELTIEIINKENARAIAEQQLKNQRLITFFLLFLLLTAVIFLILTIRYVKKRNKLYKHIVSTHINLLEEEEKSNIPQTEITETESVQSNDEEVGAVKLKTQDLFNELNRLMTECKIFSNPLLTREEVIQRLQTNSTYLTQSIRENAGMNYSQYVNSFRIKEALRLMSDKSKIKIPIKDLAEEAGFNSTTTFYKLFQEEVGISPAAYRKSLQSL